MSFHCLNIIYFSVNYKKYNLDKAFDNIINQNIKNRIWNNQIKHKIEFSYAMVFLYDTFNVTCYCSMLNLTVLHINLANTLNQLRLSESVFESIPFINILDKFTLAVRLPGRWRRSRSRDVGGQVSLRSDISTILCAA